jgi:hypothetical protein
MRLHDSRSHPLLVESLEDRFLLSLSGPSIVVRGPATDPVSMISLAAPDSTSQTQATAEEYSAQVETSPVERTAGDFPKADLLSVRVEPAQTTRGPNQAGGVARQVLAPASPVAVPGDSLSVRETYDAYLRKEHELGDHAPVSEARESRLQARLEATSALLMHSDSEGVSPHATGEEKVPGIESSPRGVREAIANPTGELLAAHASISGTTPAPMRRVVLLGPTPEATAIAPDSTPGNVLIPGEPQPVETTPAVGGDERPFDARPESGMPLPGFLPFDFAELQQSVDNFFHTLGALGQGEEAVQLGLRAAPWIALTAVLAWEFAARARKKPRRPDSAEHGPERFAFGPGDES